MKNATNSWNYPNFFIIGAPNAGTTSLWRLLSEHPDIFMPKTKEPRFFSKKENEQDWAWYQALFQGVTNEKAIGEASVNYCETHIFKNTADRLHRFNPSARLIFAVRDPINRINSCWKQALSTGHWFKYYYHPERMPLDFEEAVFSYPHFYETTLYYRNLSVFRRCFSRQQIKVIFFEDFTTKTLETVQDIYSFLEVDPDYVPSGIYHPTNVGKKKKMHHISFKLVANTIYHLPLPEMAKTLMVNKLANIWPKCNLIESHWSDEGKKHFLKLIRNDAIKILSYGNKPSTFWSIED